MKKLFVLLIIFFTFAVSHFTNSQTVDTSAWAFKTVGGDGTYRLLQNRAAYLGKSAGTVIIPIQFDVNGVDTSSWGFLPIGSDGTYRLVYNKATYYGKDSGTVVAQLVYPTGNSTGTATTSTGTATLNKLHGVVTTDNLTGNNDATITINNSFVKSTSIITLGIQLNPADVGGGQYPTYAITVVSDGSFEIKFAMATTFNYEANIHFTITNP